jgi:hypothetical protein
LFAVAHKPQALGASVSLSFGAFPDVSLASARSKRDDARKLIARGINPSDQKRLDKLAAEVAANNTFRAVAEEFLKNLEESGAAEATLFTRWVMRPSN